MTKIRITKEFSFDAAHILPHYDGKCRNIHGHTYKLQVTVLGTPCTDENSPKCGMVLDFSLFKTAIKEPIIDAFDHALIVPQNSHLENLKNIQQDGKFIELPFQPTCENMILYFVRIIQKYIPKDVELFSVRLYETPTSFAEWFASDNQ